MVPASEASTYGYYVCPVCKADVFLRRGDHRVAHFAHKSGLALPECELYFPSGDINNLWPTVQIPSHDHPASESERISPIGLGIALEPETQVRAKRLRKWKLVVMVPKSADSHGQISIDCGAGFQPKISLSKLCLGPQTYPADPDSIDYGAVWVSPEVRPEYRSAVTQRLPGLKSGGVTAFATGAEKIKPRVKGVSWATSYYFVWSKDRPFSLPPELPSHRLADVAAWCCALVSLPDEASPELSNWLRETCALIVAHDKRKWSILYPVAYDVDVSGRIRLPPTPSLFVGTFAGSDVTDGESSLECTAGDLRASVLAEPGGWHFFEVTANGASIDSVLALKWDHNPLPELARVSHSDAELSLAVIVDFRSRRDGALSRGSLHHVSCLEALKRVRASELDISGVRVPSAISGEMRWRTTDQIEWQSVALNDAASRDVRGQTTALSVEQVFTINSRLQEPMLEAWCSFGPFGEFYAGIAHPAPAARSKPRLQSAIRAKIIWFCKASQAYGTPPHDSLDRLDDDELIAHFARVPALPSLIAHRRSIQHGLKSPGGPKASNE